MRARFVNENVNFERGKDPKQSMGIGINNYNDYIQKELGEEEANHFWEVHYNLANQQKTGDLVEDYLDLLYKVPLEDQIEWANNKLEWWKEAKEEGWI